MFIKQLSFFDDAATLLPVASSLPPVFFDPEVEDKASEQLVLLKVDVTDAKGKTLESLAHSRAQRAEIIKYFGGVLPESILVRSGKSRKNEDLSTGSYGKSSSAPGTPFEVSGMGTANGGLSTFPQNVGRIVTLLYTKPNDLVLDPFAGHNSRMQLVVELGRRYEGYDVSKEFMEFNQSMALKLSNELTSCSIMLHEADSRLMQFTENESCDFTLTSPPYWNIEDYGDEPEQLGKASKGYGDFLLNMKLVMMQNWRVLKPGAFCVYFVNDFRRNGIFYPYHMDTCRLLLEAGFVPWDIVIVDLGTSIKAAFATQIIRDKILPKRHEYSVVVRKPF